MKILTSLIEKSYDTLEEIEEYTQKAYHLRTEHKSLADTYIKVAEMHITIYNMLHEKMVMLIEEEKRKGVEIPKGMQEIWAWEHQKLIKRFGELKYIIEDYKKLSY